jgi:hypothetical protein
MAATLTSKAPGSYIVGAWGGWNSSALPFSLQADVTEDGSEQNSTTSTSRGCAGHYAPSSFPNQTVIVGATDSDAQATAAVYEIMAGQDVGAEVVSVTDIYALQIPTQTAIQGSALQSNAFQEFGGGGAPAGPSGSQIEPVTPSDTLAVNKIATASQTDTATPSDAYARGLAANRSQTETATLSDALAAATAIAKSLVESATATETWAVNKALTAAQTESATTSDAFDAQVGGGGASATQAESVTVTDSFAPALWVEKGIIEAATATDAYAAQLGAPLSGVLIESATASDAYAANKTIGMSLLESVNAVDAYAPSGQAPVAPPSTWRPGRTRAGTFVPWWKRPQFRRAPRRR